MDVLLFLLFSFFPPTKTFVAVELCPVLSRRRKIAMHRRTIAGEPQMDA
jgi:hypothetical protein